MAFSQPDEQGPQEEQPQKRVCPLTDEKLDEIIATVVGELMDEGLKEEDIPPLTKDEQRVADEWERTHVKPQNP